MRILLLLALSFFICTSSRSQTQYKVLSVTDFKTKLEQDTTIQLVDVRTLQEFTAGHISKAVNINYWGDDFENDIQQLDKNRPVLLYCKTGIRSGKAAAVMQKLGFKELYNLKGGYEKWTVEGKR
jgi:rhodanese-related sulfurtransferase